MHNLIFASKFWAKKGTVYTGKHGTHSGRETISNIEKFSYIST